MTFVVKIAVDPLRIARGPCHFKTLFSFVIIS